ncbi:uncharacterized protein LOC114748167 [Neltuma alba]|uniref:uncharacterized protein LOC114732002 n=1 Tax=Neltuma alba TaxID=207710 RepID=UPI0010A46F5F|nr:uncharacterized protein LOC114732002 [Prosopis alba]XP_028775118.1 uncharacterized protein LOC114732012 [Prosopis alba]XP_028792353.1 uncharacterized protein LOC114748167 [Prosopis alba]
MSPCCDRSTENQLTLANADKEDPKSRGKKMERDEGLNTVVRCLRGRLLAERQASRVANEEAESMGNKLVELEKKLRDEIELREKAEKRLKKLKKKLQSLKLFSISEESVQLSSPEKSESSCWRSPASSSASRDSEASGTKTRTTDSYWLENAMHSVSEPSASMTHGYDDSQGSDNSTSNSNSDCSSPKNSISQDLKHDESSSTSRSSSKDSSSQDLKNDECRLSGLSSKSSVTEYEDDDRDFIDNSLALVPVNFPITNTEARKVKPVHESVVEALDALRHAREKLLCSMGTRHMIQVGPT